MIRTGQIAEENQMFFEEKFYVLAGYIRLCNYSVIKKCNGTQMTRMIMMNADNRETASK